MSMSPPSTADAEADAEQARAGLVTTLSRLRENLQPSNVVNEVMTHARVGVSAVGDQVLDAARKNPLPALMIGAGLAMIFGFGTKATLRSGGTASPIRQTPSTDPRGPEFAMHVAPEASAAGPDIAAQRPLKPRAGSALDDANARLAEAAARAVPTGEIFDDNTTKENPMSSNPSRNRMMRSLSKAIEEQPLILAAVGVAVGAAIGAAIPRTDAENNLMGESSHSVREAAQDLAQDQYAQLKSAASHAVEDIKQSVADHGGSTENLSEMVHDVGEKAKAAAQEAGRSLDPTA